MTKAVATVIIVVWGVARLNKLLGSFRWSTRYLNTNGTWTFITYNQHKISDLVQWRNIVHYHKIYRPWIHAMEQLYIGSDVPRTWIDDSVIDPNMDLKFVKYSYTPILPSPKVHICIRSHKLTIIYYIVPVYYQLLKSIWTCCLVVV